MTSKTTNNIKAIILGLVLTVGIGYAAAATFVGPKCAPPGCNADAPVTVGGNDAGIIPYSQIKTGILSLMHLITPDLTVTNSDGVTPVTVGQVLTATDTTGKVGWQTIAATTPGSIVVCSKTASAVFAGIPGAAGTVSYAPADCGGHTIDSTYYGATKGVNATAGNGAQAAAQFVPPFKTLNVGEGGPAIQLFGQCTGASGCFYYVSSVYIKLGGGGSSGTPAGLVVGGYTASMGGGNTDQWGVASTGACPAAYKTVQTSDTGGKSGDLSSITSSYLCLTK